MPYYGTNRSKKLEAEHIVPRSRLAKYWGSKEEAKKQLAYRYMESDLRNLYPSNGGLNEARSNYRFGIVDGEPRDFGTCDFEVKNETVEPKEDIQGDIARIYFHMDSSYQEFTMTEEERELMKLWDSSHPVSNWERGLNSRIDEDLEKLENY